MIDRYTKFILTVIGFSLMLNAINPWIAPMDVEAYRASRNNLEAIAQALDSIAVAIR